MCRELTAGAHRPGGTTIVAYCPCLAYLGRGTQCLPACYVRGVDRESVFAAGPRAFHRAVSHDVWHSVAGCSFAEAPWVINPQGHRFGWRPIGSGKKSSIPPFSSINSFSKPWCFPTAPSIRWQLLRSRRMVLDLAVAHCTASRLCDEPSWACGGP